MDDIKFTRYLLNDMNSFLRETMLGFSKKVQRNAFLEKQRWRLNLTRELLVYYCIELINIYWTFKMNFTLKIVTLNLMQSQILKFIQTWSQQADLHQLNKCQTWTSRCCLANFP